LFILSVNSLLLLLKKHGSYKVRTRKEHNNSYLFFVVDPKHYLQNIKTAKKMLETVSMFSKDTGMKFGELKYAYQYMERGKRNPLKIPLIVNNLALK